MKNFFGKPEREKSFLDKNDIKNERKDTNQQGFKDFLSVHSTSEWKTVLDKITPIVKGNASLDQILDVIRNFIQTFEHQNTPNVEQLKEFLTALDSQTKSEYEKCLFPGIAKLILKTPQLFPERIPLLVQGCPREVNMSKEQCACLLAHMLMCITIKQKNDRLHTKYSFSEIFSSSPSRDKVKAEKIACIFHYFKRILNDVVTNHGIVFQRLVYNERIHGKCSLEAWKECNEKLREIQVRLKGDIADELETVEVDFANKFVGGRSLGTDASREQILFITSPELLVGLLLFEHMVDDEAILIRGVEKYCISKGYAENFAFSSNFIDKHPITEDNIKDREILAVDAFDFRLPTTNSEFSPEAMLRELKKAYVGFFGNNFKNKLLKKKRIATGKWGCGAFQGHPQLKFLLQWLAASRAGRDTLFYLFDEEKDLDGVERIIHHYKGKTVGELFTDMLNQIDLCMEKPENFLHLLDKPIIEKNKVPSPNKLPKDRINHGELIEIDPFQNCLAEKNEELSSNKLLEDCLNYVEFTTIDPIQNYLEEGPQQILFDKVYNQVETDLLTNVKNCLEDFQTKYTSFDLCLAFRNLFHYSSFANLFRDTGSLLSSNFATV